MKYNVVKISNYFNHFRVKYYENFLYILPSELVQNSDFLDKWFIVANSFNKKIIKLHTPNYRPTQNSNLYSIRCSLRPFFHIDTYEFQINTLKYIRITK